MVTDFNECIQHFIWYYFVSVPLLGRNDYLSWNDDADGNLVDHNLDKKSIRKRERSCYPEINKKAYNFVSCEWGNRYFCYQDGKGLRSYDENGKNEKKLFEWQYEISSVCRDEKYLYFDNEPCADSVSERRIMVVDYDGNVICERKNMTENSPEIIWSDSKQVLLQNIEKETYQILNVKEISTLK